MNKLKRSYEILDELRLPNGLYLASSSNEYHYSWTRDNVYISLAYLDKPCNTFEKTYHRLLDYYREYEWKLDHHIKVKPELWYEFMHIRYSADEVKEIPVEWSHSQNDAHGCFLWAIGEGIKKGKKMLRDDKDREIIQKLVWYLNTLEYWNCEDSCMWEEHREIHTSSIVACVAGLENVSDIVYIPAEMIQKGYKAIFEIFPKETPTRDVDLSLLSLIYPYNILPKPMAQLIIHNVEKELLREKGVIRYRFDSYYSTLEKEYGRHQPLEFYDKSEPSWVFGLSFLANSHMMLGNLEKGKYYIDKINELFVEDGYLPELYYAGDYVDERGKNYNVNCPLLWTQSMYIQSVEMYEKLSKESTNKTLTQVN